MEDHLRVPPEGPHPQPEEIWRARREPGSEGAAQILDHVALCARCSEELYLQEAFEGGQAVPPAKLEREWARFTKKTSLPEPLRFAPRRSWVRPALALAATAAFCFLGVSLLWKEGGPAGDGPPPAAGEEVVRGAGELKLIRTPAGELTEAPRAFHFPGITAPVRVTVFDAEGTYRWTSEPTTTGEAPFPEVERAKLKPGTDYYWTLVDAPTSEAAVSFRVR